MEQLTDEQKATLTDEQKQQLSDLSDEATTTAEAMAKTSAFRLKIALQGAKSAAYSVILFRLLVKVDGRSALGKATANALASFKVFELELSKEIEAAKEASGQAQNSGS